MKFPIEMYGIREEDLKIKVPCERCAKNGIVNKECYLCGGNGVRSKTIKVWKVAPGTVVVEAINRASSDEYYKDIQVSYKGGLRYWISSSECFNEENKLLHFNIDDAQEECDRRNVEIADILRTHEVNKKYERKVIS